MYAFGIGIGVGVAVAGLRISCVNPCARPVCDRPCYIRVSCQLCALLLYLYESLLV